MLPVGAVRHDLETPDYFLIVMVVVGMKQLIMLKSFLQRGMGCVKDEELTLNLNLEMNSQRE